MIFETIDDYFTSDTFVELSEFELREYREGRGPRVSDVIIVAKEIRQCISAARL